MRKSAALIGAPTLAAVAIAACGAGGGSNMNTSTNAAATGNSGSGQATLPATDAARSAGLKFSQCMRANGVPSFPDPGSGSGGGIQISASKTSGSGNTMRINGVSVNAPAFQAALQTCQKDIPHHPPSASQVAQHESKAISLAKCMRAHGVPAYPDPRIVTGPGGIGIRIGFGLSSGITQSPAFQQAQQECSSFLSFLGGAGSGAVAAPGGGG
jgi:hypothetical protein